MSEKVNQVLDIIDEHPELLDSLVHSNTNAQGPSRLANGANAFVRTIAGNQLSEQDILALQQALQDNKVVQLYEYADGALDAKELLQYVGGLTGTKANNDNPAVRALFDGRLDLKEILLVILLLKLFKRKQTSSYNYYGNTGLFGSLFGNTQPSYQGGLFSNLFGQNQVNNPYGLYGNLFTNNQSSGLFGNLYGNQNNSLFGVSQQPNSLMDVLNGFVNGNYNNNQQAYQLYNLLGNASQNAFNQSGTINVQSLFSILNSLLK